MEDAPQGRLLRRGLQPAEHRTLSSGGASQPAGSTAMNRSCVPRGSVGRATVARELEPVEVDESAEEAELADCSTIRRGALQLAAASGEAATEVGAALSAKDRRTYWEVCLEGKKVREHWNAEFEATVKRNEEEAADFWDSLSKKQKDQQRGWILGEHRNMKRGDRESKIYMTIDVMHEQLRRYRSQELRIEIPSAAFMCGQSVLQWWAPWMKDAPETPAHYNRKNRPAWFSAEISSYCRYGDIKYAGQTTRAHQYHVY